MIEAGEEYAGKSGYEEVGMYFQVVGSVRALQMHVIDEKHTGQSFKSQAHKNLPAEFVREDIDDELDAFNQYPKEGGPQGARVPRRRVLQQHGRSSRVERGSPRQDPAPRRRSAAKCPTVRLFYMYM
jgi:hypothetical protein